MQRDLIPIELGSDFYNSQIPFDVKRIYYISYLMKIMQLEESMRTITVFCEWSAQLIWRI